MDESCRADHSARPEPSSISTTLLDRLRAARPEAWERLVALYGPTVYRWCRLSGVGRDDAGDVVQEVFAAAAGHVAQFRRRGPDDSFGGWLRTITRNKIRDHFRRLQSQPHAPGGTHAQQALLNVGEPPELSQAAGLPEAEVAFLRRALALVREEFESRTWEAFWRAVIDGREPAQIGEELGMSIWAVYQAKSRVLRRLRQELGDLV